MNIRTGVLVVLTVAAAGGSAAPAPAGLTEEVWRKQSDGTWKIIRDVFNSDVPLPAPAPTPVKK